MESIPTKNNEELKHWGNKVPILGDGHLKERMDGCPDSWTAAPQKKVPSQDIIWNGTRPVRMKIASFGQPGHQSRQPPTKNKFSLKKARSLKQDRTNDLL